jgi:fumarate reductase flavoprotein subunit
LSVEPVASRNFTVTTSVVIVGAGAAGLCAALAAHEIGADVVVLERDSLPRGSTALSAGLIPAAGTRFQVALGIDDSAARFAEDILRKAHGGVDPEIVAAIAKAAGPTVEWLADRYGFPFTVVHDFDYPGHAVRRMHGLPSRSGVELIDRLHQTADRQGVTILTDATVTRIFADPDNLIHGVGASRPDGTEEYIGCKTLVLACNGYGGAPELVAHYIPEMLGAYYFGHAGNQGDAVLWGRALGAKLQHMSGYQGHGSVAHPHGILITWAVIMEGGFQVNAGGQRFSNESLGYSEQAAIVLAQPGGTAFDIFDERIATIARQFEDFRQAEAAGAIIEASTISALAEKLKLPTSTLAESFGEVDAAKTSGAADKFGRSFAGRPQLSPPFKAVKVTGALFHTQGGLAVDRCARVLTESGAPLPNLFAAGGAAVGVSGSTAAGYLSGNGLLTATVLGRVAGENAAKIFCSGRQAAMLR